MIKTPKKIKSDNDEKLGKRQGTILNFVTPVKKFKPQKKGKSYKSTIKGYGMPYDCASPGDLVMAFASDIKHPAYLAGKINRSFIFFGVVRNFVYVQWNTGLGDKEWDGVIENHERLNIRWAANIPDWDTKVDVPPPTNQWVKVLALKNDPQLDDINEFLIDGINEHFFYSDQEGWLIM